VAKIRDFGLAKKAENNKKKQVSSSLSQGGCFVCGCLQGIQFGISILKPPQKNFRERLPKIPPFVSEIDNKELAGLSDAEGVADDEFSPSSCSKEWNFTSEEEVSSLSSWSDDPEESLGTTGSTFITRDVLASESLAQVSA
jgi:hypothetical protein